MARRTGKKAVQDRLYIAYGSNLNLPQMEQRCPYAKVVGASEIKNYELLFRGFATVEPKEGATVPVLLWKIEPLDEAALDRYEGWPHLYRKEMMDVELEGKNVSAMVYVMNDERSLGMPSEVYYRIIEEGYHSVGFDTAVLEHALARTEEMMEQENAQYHQQGFDDMDGFHL